MRGAQRTRAACLAISLRRSFESFAARAFPPFLPPNLPSATACGFFSAASGASGASGSARPVARSPISFALWFASLGILERFCMPPSVARRAEGR